MADETTNAPATADSSKEQKPVPEEKAPGAAPAAPAEKPPEAGPLQSAADRLYGGNAIVDAAPNPAPNPNPAQTPVISQVSEMRTLREAGIEARLEAPHPEPERPDIEKQMRAQQPGDGVRVVRTYAADMSEEIRKRGETLSTIVGAEQRKAEIQGAAPPEEGAKRDVRRLMLLGGAGILILAGIAVLVGIFFFSTPKTVPSQTAPLIGVNKSEVLVYDGAHPLAEGLSPLREAARMNLGEIEEISITKNDMPLSASEILSALHAPDLLSRNALAVTVGLHAFNKTQPFILIKVSAYDLAFQAMLTWESSLGENLGEWFAPSVPGRPLTPPRLSFTDSVIQNVDVRKSNAEWPILYAFPKKDLLLITTNESTLKEVLTRLASGAGAN